MARWLALLVLLASCKKTQPTEASASAKPPAITEPADICARFDLLEERAGKKKPDRDQARKVCPEQMVVMRQQQPEQYDCVVACVAQHDLYDELVACSLACVLAHPAGSAVDAAR